MAVQPAGFYGRAEELRVLVERARAAFAGHPQVAFVEGEAGIGKSRLTGEVAARLTAAGARVFTGVADEIAARPFRAIAGALGCTPSAPPDSARRDIAQMISDVESAAAEVPYRVIDAMVDLVDAEAQSSPLVLILEDLHWADPGTLAALHAIRQMENIPVFVLGTMRPTPRSEELERVLLAASRGGALILRLGPLEHDVVRQIAADLVDADPGPHLVEQLAGTGGNPLYVCELLGALRDEGSIETHGNLAETAASGLPPTVRLTILRRISFLGNDVLDLLRSAALLGSSFSTGDLAVVVGCDVTELLPTLDTAIRSGFITAEKEQSRFRHDLIREAIYEDLAPDVRAALHRRVAQAFAAAGYPAMRVAEHFQLGARAGDREAASWLRRAAGEAKAVSPTLAVDLLERARDLLGPTHPEAIEVSVELMHALEGAHRFHDEIALARELLRGDLPPEVAADVHEHLAGSLPEGGDEGIEHDRAAAKLRPPNDTQRIWAAYRETLSLLREERYVGAERVARAALDTVDRVGDRLVVWMRYRLASALFGLGRQDEARQTLEDLITEGTRSLDRLDAESASVVLGGLGYAASDLGRHDEALRFMERAVSMLDADGGVAAIAGAYDRYADVLWSRGMWDDAVTAWETSERVRLQFGFSIWPQSLVSRAYVSFHRDRTEHAGRLLDRLDEHELNRPPNVDEVRSLRTMLEADRGNEAFVRAVRALVDEHTPFRADEIVLMLREAGEEELAREVAARALQGTLSSIARLALLEAHATGSTEPLVRARAEVPVTPPSIAAASLRIELARVTDDAADRRVLFDEAAMIFETLGATRELRRLRAAMRAAGIVTGARGKRTRATTGWDALTASEQNVVRLAATGLTNPQIGERLFISKRTVQTHLAHAFGKLGIATRRELPSVVPRETVS